MRLFPTLTLALVFVVACLSPTGAAERVALVIGKSGYELISPLTNPENDASLMAEALREVGFEVIEAKNADQKTIKRTIRDFGKRLSRAGPEAVRVDPKASRQPGETFKDCVECPEMVVIPPGWFRMGDLSGGGYGNEKPVHAVTIGYKLAVGKFEVTFDEWKACVADLGCGGHHPDDGGWGRGRWPVIDVSWDDANAYARWLSGRTGQEYRLLSESEWEYVARAGSITKYPFGNSEDGLCDYGNGADRSTGFEWRNKSCGDGSGKRTVPVGSYRPNAFGIFDTLGNVWEWTEDFWHDDYHGAPGNGGAWTIGGERVEHVLRGGSWYDEPRVLRSANRIRNLADNRSIYYGFRVARTL